MDKQNHEYHYRNIMGWKKFFKRARHDRTSMDHMQKNVGGIRDIALISKIANLLNLVCFEMKF